MTIRELTLNARHSLLNVEGAAAIARGSPRNTRNSAVNIKESPMNIKESSVTGQASALKVRESAVNVGIMIGDRGDLGVRSRGRVGAKHSGNNPCKPDNFRPNASPLRGYDRRSRGYDGRSLRSPWMANSDCKFIGRSP